MAEAISYLLGGTAMSILAFVIVIMVGPLLGGTFESVMPDLSATSEWNTSYNTDIPTGVEVWEQTIPFLVVAAIVIIAGLIIFVIRGVA